MNAAASTSPPSSPLGLLTDRAFVRVWLVGLLNGSVRWLEVLAIGVYTLEITGSALSVALLLFARMLPGVLFGALLGVLAERVDRGRLLRIGFGVLAVVAAGLASLALSGHLALWHVAIGAFLAGMVWALDQPARRTLLGEIAGLERLGAGMSMDSATQNATRMLGPTLGGMVYATIGLPGAYVISACAYCAVVALLWRLGASAPARAGGGPGLLRTLADGLSYASRDRRIAGVLAVTVLMNLCGFSYMSMVPVIGDRVLGLDPAAVGLLMSADGLGAFLGGIALVFFVRPPHYDRIFVAGSLVFLVMVVLFSASAWFALSAASLFVAGFGMSGFAAMQSTILIAASPPEVRSRVMGLLVVCIGAAPLGILAVGLLAERLGAAVAVGIASGSGLVAMLALLSVWRR